MYRTNSTLLPAGHINPQRCDVTFPVLIFVLIAVLLSIPRASAQSQSNSANRRPPNIILIMADDIGVECFGSYGGTSYETPVLDRLALEGMRFTNCYSQPLCTPSRVKIMTGRSNVRNYARFGILEPDERTFAHCLKDVGYRTCVVGKWQLHGNENDGKHAGTGASPTDAGFDEYCLWQISKVGSRYADPVIDVNGAGAVIHEGRYGPDVFVEYLEGFIEQQKDGPFFIYYPMALVHNPFEPPPDSDLEIEDRTRQLNFADMVRYMDQIVGRIEVCLDRHELTEQTLILFTSDNGTNKAIRSMMGVTEVRGGKGLTTNAGTHVPLIASWPGVIDQRKPCDDLIDFSDVLPTLVDVAGIEPPDELDGVSFFPQIKGESGTPREFIYCYYWPRPERENWPAVRFARDRHWKLYHDGRLYDVANDPLELQPIAPDVESREDAAARAKLQEVIDSHPDTGVRIR